MRVLISTPNCSMFDLLLCLTGMVTGEFSLWALELALGEGKKRAGGELDMVIIGANCFFISQKW